VFYPFITALKGIISLPGIMDYNSVKELLSNLSLNLDMDTIDRIYNFLGNEVGLLDETSNNPRMIVYAVAAIIAEN
jgi:hypothetical protein